MKKILALATLLFVCFCSVCMAEPRIVELTWEQDICEDLAGWRLYVSNTSGSGYYYVPNQTDPLSTLTFVYDQEMDKYSDSIMVEVPVGVPTTFYFALTALDDKGNESAYSDEDDKMIFIARFFIEAEEGVINLPMEIAVDEAASSGEYIWVPNGNGNSMDPLQDAGYAEYTFEIIVAGDYVVWGRVISNDSGSDSFFASIDNGEYALWDTRMGGEETWVWGRVSDRGFADPVIFHLETGVHTLVIKQREDGTKIDRILITNDMEHVPEGLGGEITTTTTSAPTTTTTIDEPPEAPYNLEIIEIVVKLIIKNKMSKNG